ncbi:MULTISPECIES: integrase [Streptomyces]|uniref:integrase n=1 Tax=Streptomyces TaxID=1883 RepID=UPI0026B2CF53|nr:integrase [Streptomyces sp. WAC05858]
MRASARPVLLVQGRASGHPAQTRAPHRYLRWRNASARHPDVLAAQRRERSRIRSEKGIRWGGRPLAGVA